jgi:hypothetical protein
MNFQFYPILRCDTVRPGNNMPSSQMQVLSAERGNPSVGWWAFRVRCGGERTRALLFVRATEWEAANCHSSLMRVYQVFKLIFSPDIWKVLSQISWQLIQETERASNGRYTGWVQNNRRISLRHKSIRKCRTIVKFVSITQSERNICNGPIVATAISQEKRKQVLEGNCCLTDQA